MTTSPADWPTDPTRALLVLDFDGTLAPIVADPTTSAMPDRTAAVVARLARVLDRVAIISGRPAAFLLERAALPGVELRGLYGLEAVVDGRVEVAAEVAAWQPAVDRAKADLARAVADVDGAWVEDKGLAVAVHWRNAADPAAAGRRVVAAVDEVAAATGLRREDGKLVAELRPPVQADKGTAVRLLADGAAEVAYAGDDLGDLPGFSAVHERGGLAVAVDHGPETPEAVTAAADLVVDGTEGLVAWLEALAARLG